MGTAELVTALVSAAIGAALFARIGLLLFDRTTRAKGMALAFAVSIGLMGILVGLIYYQGITQGKFSWTLIDATLGFGVGMVLGLILAGIFRISRR